MRDFSLGSGPDSDWQPYNRTIFPLDVKANIHLLLDPKGCLCIQSRANVRGRRNKLRFKIYGRWNLYIPYFPRYFSTPFPVISKPCITDWRKLFLNRNAGCIQNAVSSWKVIYCQNQPFHSIFSIHRIHCLACTQKSLRLVLFRSKLTKSSTP